MIMEDLKTEPEMMGKDRQIANSSKDHIPGWGIDADPENDPTYPMKHWNGADHERLNYQKPPQQPVDIEVLKSIERPAITRVFGTSTPPSGLSGSIRRYAFRYSEATTAHWMALLLADRVNVVEGLFDDIKQGTFPNIFKERGWSAEWKYNKRGFLKSAVTGIAIATALIVLCAPKATKSE
jgi:hypothetical protein